MSKKKGQRMRISPLLDPGIPDARRVDHATRLIQRLVEHFLLGGSLRAWQIVHMLRMMASLWESRADLSHDESTIREWALQRYEREHWSPCSCCGGLGVVNRPCATSCKEGSA